MTVGRPRRLIMQDMLRPETVLVLGADSGLGRLAMANIAAAGFKGRVAASIGQDVPDLTLLAVPPEAMADNLRAVAAAGGRAAVALGPAPDLGAAARAAGVRVLGPNSFGVAVPGIGLNASLCHMAVPAGNIALVTQSASLARAVVDWAGPNGVGFSHVVGVGGNEDVGFGLVLDFLARDPGTKLILLDIRRVRDRRVFMSAARAAARLRPIVALWPGLRLPGAGGEAAAVAEAALNRAGVFTVRDLEGFLAAAETLSRARPLRGETMAVVTNAIGPGRLAADAALAAGIELAVLPAEAQAALTASLPAALLEGLVYTGSLTGGDAASVAAMISAVPSVGGVLVLLAPAGAMDEAAIEMLAAAAATAKLPVIACVMGESTGAAHRRRLAAAGVPVFAAPAGAVRAFEHLLRDRRARLASREVPSSRVVDLQPDHAAVDAILQAARAASHSVLTAAQALGLLAAYGLAAADGAPQMAVRVHDDATFGPVIGLSRLPGGAVYYELPPLNLSLARNAARRAGLAAETEAGHAAAALVRVGQMLCELPQIATLEAILTAEGAAISAALTLRPPGDVAVLAISPYPEHLVASFQAKGVDFIIRPIRPEDAEAHEAMIARVPPADLRYRFFSSLRQVAPEQMARLTQIDYGREMAFIAVRVADGTTAGVARLVRDAGAQGEFAILIAPEAKGLGLARHLMERLIDWARFAGIATITGQVLAGNAPMLGFIRHLGFALHRLADEPDIVEAVLDVTAGI